MATRTFLALALDERIVARLLDARRRLDAADAQVRWVERENLHLTVKFLGGVEDRLLHEVCQAAQAIAGQVEAFEFGVGGLVSVPPAGQLRMIWANIDEPTAHLAKLNDLAEEAYGALGFKREHRQFHPHMTLGRVKSGRNVAQLRAAVGEFADVDFGLQAAEEIIVFASELTPDGPIHSPLTRARLAQGG